MTEFYLVHNGLGLLSKTFYGQVEWYELYMRRSDCNNRNMPISKLAIF